MRVDLMPLLALARRDHTKAWEHLVVNDEGELDRLAAEASGLADRGELYTDKFPGKQACVEKIEADEAATGDAWYDEEEEEEAMLRQEDGRAGGGRGANHRQVQHRTQLQCLSWFRCRKLHICLAWPCFCSCDEQVVGSQDCLWYCVPEGLRTNEQAVGVGAIQTFLDTHPLYPAWISKKKQKTQHRTTNQLIIYSV